VLILFISITQVLSSDPESPSTVDQADSVVVEYNDFIKVYGI
jgi:peroxin-6